MDVNVTKPPVTKKAAKKRGRERVCFDFSRSGECKYGDTCKYLHEAPAEGVKTARETLRDDAESRQTFGKRAKQAETVADAAAEETARKLSPMVNAESMLDRYYKRLYAADVGDTPGCDQFVHVHSNRVTVIGVASHHNLVTSSAKAVSVEFVTGRERVAEVKVSGRQKHGAVRVEPDSVVCEVTMSDGTVVPVVSCVGGTVMELNQRIVETPSLLQSSPEVCGYVAMLRPLTPEAVVDLSAHLLSYGEYKKLRAVVPL